MPPKYTPQQAIAAFWSKIEVKAPDECWPWTASRNSKGYGLVGWQGKTTGAHRVAFFISGGFLTESQQVCHTCDHPYCCNPSHLFAGTSKENTADSITKGRWPSGKRRGTAKLTEEQVLAIRTDHALGIGYRRLAAKYRISRTAAGDIIRGRTWKQVHT